MIRGGQDREPGTLALSARPLLDAGRARALPAGYRLALMGASDPRECVIELPATAYTGMLHNADAAGRELADQRLPRHVES